MTKTCTVRLARNPSDLAPPSGLGATIAESRMWTTLPSMSCREDAICGSRRKRSRRSLDYVRHRLSGRHQRTACDAAAEGYD